MKAQSSVLLALILARISQITGVLHQKIHGAPSLYICTSTTLNDLIFRWLYRLFVGIDANFRAKRKNVSSYDNDPALNNGIAYFVEDTHYKNFLKQFGDQIQEESSTCNNHEALAKAGTKNMRGWATTGIVTIECTRHDMKRPCSVGDLQKGERFASKHI